MLTPNSGLEVYTIARYALYALVLFVGVLAIVIGLTLAKD